MQIFNLGLGEVIFILLIAVVVVGPERIVVFSREAGKWLRALVGNPLWHEVVATSIELRDLPNQLLEESGLNTEVQAISAEIVDMDQSVTCDMQKSMSFLPADIKPIRDETTS